ncbi:MAG: DUF4040 domain-containing protein [Thermoanaerobaculia bacterium]
MISIFHATILVLIAITGTATVLEHDPKKQVLIASIFGLQLTLYFFSVSAPDVALSELVVGMIALPAVTLIAIARIERDRQK